MFQSSMFLHFYIFKKKEKRFGYSWTQWWYYKFRHAYFGRAHGKKITDPSLGKAGYLAMPSPRGYNGETFDGLLAIHNLALIEVFMRNHLTLKLQVQLKGQNSIYP